MNNEGLSEIDGPFPVPPPRDNRERNDNQEQREEATGTSAVCKPLLPSIIVIGSRPIIVTTLTVGKSHLLTQASRGKVIFFLWVEDDIQVGKLNHAWRGNLE